jgi:hypothetical protein
MRKAILSLVAAAAIAGFVYAAASNTQKAPTVAVLRTPHEGIQPQIVEKDGVIHLLYFTGEASGGNLNYVQSRDNGRTFSTPIRVNSETGTAMAVGNMRGGQIAIGGDGRVHVAWIGSKAAKPRAANNSAPVLYARLNSAGTAFEKQRGLNSASWGADGATLAADTANNVYVVWHAQQPGGKSEADRRVWMAKSGDGGKTFAEERAIFGKTTGVCGCCGSRAVAGTDGSLYILFRSATEMVHRDIWLLSSSDHGSTFQGTDVAPWKIGACVMSSAAFLPTSAGLLSAWETEKRVYAGRIAPGAHAVSSQVGAPTIQPAEENQKYPAIATNAAGQIALVWAEHMAWNKGGQVAWQIYDKNLKPVGPEGRADGIPKWGVPAVFSRADGSFAVMF